MKKKKVAIIQSNYIPWKGYFDIINMVDEFIIYDDCQYTKNDWRNRNKIKNRAGLQWLTIPVKYSFPQLIKDTVISDDGWNRKHWKTIVQNYSKSRYFEDYKDIFEELYLGTDEKYLSLINYRFISKICDILGINTKISWSMNYNLVEGKTDRLIDLCKQTCASEYISGPAAKRYIEDEMFVNAGIKLSYVDYSGYKEYNQMHFPFEHGVTILDLIFNEGINAPLFMKHF